MPRHHYSAERHCQSLRQDRFVKNRERDDMQGETPPDNTAHLISNWSSPIHERRPLNCSTVPQQRSSRQASQSYRALRITVERLTTFAHCVRPENTSHQFAVSANGAPAAGCAASSRANVRDAAQLICTCRATAHRSQRPPIVPLAARGTRYSPRRRASTRSLPYSDRSNSRAGSPSCFDSGCE